MCGIGISIACGTATPRGVWSGGVDVKSVSELLGHADVRTTLRLYVHSSMDYKRRAVEGIGFLKGIM